MAPLIIPLTKSKTLTTEGDTDVNVYLIEFYFSYAIIQKEKKMCSSFVIKMKVVSTFLFQNSTTKKSIKLVT